MIGGIISKVLFGGVLDKVFDLVSKHQKKEITKAQMESELRQTLAESTADIEKQWAKTQSDVYSEAQKTVRDSFKAKDWPTRNAWAIVLYSQLFYLFWYQWVVPFSKTFFDIQFAATGNDLLYWSYALITLCLGGIGLQKENRERASKIIESLKSRK